MPDEADKVAVAIVASNGAAPLFPGMERLLRRFQSAPVERNRQAGDTSWIASFPADTGQVVSRQILPGGGSA